MLIDGGVNDDVLHSIANGGNNVKADNGNLFGTLFFDKCLRDTMCTTRGGNEEGVDFRMLFEHFEGVFVRLYVIIKTCCHGRDATIRLCHEVIAEAFDAVHMAKHTDAAVDHSCVYGTTAKLAQERCGRASSRSVVAADIDVGGYRMQSRYLLKDLPETFAWRLMLGLAAVPANILFLGVLRLPESPRFLVRGGMIDEARRVLGFIRSDDEVEAELQQICKTAKEESAASAENTWGVFLQSKYRYLVTAGVGVAAFQQFQGANAIFTTFR